MAAASDSVRGMINESLDRIDKLENKWMLYTVNPYSMAYDDALEAFKAKMKEQEEEDKAESLVLSLAMIALSLCGGGILTAAFGSAVLKTITVDAATKIICNNNMERAFKAAHFIATNKTASFIAGKVWDEAESKATAFVSDKIKSGLSQNAASFPSTTRFQSMTSFKMSKTLEQFIREAKDKASDLITGLRDNNNIGDMERLQQLSKIEKGSSSTADQERGRRNARRGPRACLLHEPDPELGLSGNLRALHQARDRRPGKQHRVRAEGAQIRPH
jgi:hypothetical protein